MQRAFRLAGTFFLFTLNRFAKRKRAMRRRTYLMRLALEITPKNTLQRNIVGLQ